MVELTLLEISRELNCDNHFTDTHFQGISTDTRTINSDNLFVAIQGEKYDGHHYLSEAEKKGAAAAIVNRPIDSALPQLIVSDTIIALGKIASIWRNRFHFPIIGVTGSSGKTTLKNMIAAILVAACKGDRNQVLATEGNLNNNIGVPLMLTRFNQNHCFGVIEMGTNNFGEISYLTNLVKPQVAVINNVGPSHLQGLENVAGVARAKGEIFEGLTEDGTAILNHDDEFFSYWQESMKHAYSTFGLNISSDFSATTSSNSSKFILHSPDGDIEIQLPLVGKHNIMNAVAAAAATSALDIDLATIKCGLENVEAAPGRFRQHILDNGARLIDDTYNANPASTCAAIDALAQFTGTKILILGDMKELGPEAKTHHISVGKYAKECDIDYLFTYGENTVYTAEAFGTNAKHFSDREKIISDVQNYLGPNTTILIKGSRSMAMEKVLKGLLPELQCEQGH